MINALIALCSNYLFKDVFIANSLEARDNVFPGVSSRFAYHGGGGGVEIVSLSGTKGDRLTIQYSKVSLPSKAGVLSAHYRRVMFLKHRGPLLQSSHRAPTLCVAVITLWKLMLLMQKFRYASYCSCYE